MTQTPEDEQLTVEIHAAAEADVYLSCGELDAAAWSVVHGLDRAALAAVRDPLDLELDRRRTERVLCGCSGVVAVVPSAGAGSGGASPRVLEEVRLAARLGLPLAVLHHPDIQAVVHHAAGEATLHIGACEPIPLASTHLHGPAPYDPIPDCTAAQPHPVLASFSAAVVKHRLPVRPYAFLIGRLERDFAQAREAIRAAVESEAGIPCLWADDGRHQTNVDSIRECTRRLIEHASFVIADLTLGSESPERENPSRAHEIGMSIAYGRKLMLCSQEPRRYPYFSIGDMQMTFWATEAELHGQVREWIRSRRHLLGRTVLNFQLPRRCTGCAPRIQPPSFTYDPGQRYVGPRTGTPASL